MNFMMNSMRGMTSIVGMLAALSSPGLHANDKAYPDLPHFESDIDYCKVDNDMIRETIGRYLEGKSDGKDRMVRFHGRYAPTEADRAKRTCLAYNLGMEAIRDQYHDKIVMEFCEEGARDCVEMQKGIWLRTLSHEDRP